jgi:hypothetical protein
LLPNGLHLLPQLLILQPQRPNLLIRTLSVRDKLLDHRLLLLNRRLILLPRLLHLLIGRLKSGQTLLYLWIGSLLLNRRFQISQPIVDDPKPRVGAGRLLIRSGRRLLDRFKPLGRVRLGRIIPVTPALNCRRDTGSDGGACDRDCAGGDATRSVRDIYAEVRSVSDEMMHLSTDSCSNRRGAKDAGRGTNGALHHLDRYAERLRRDGMVLCPTLPITARDATDGRIARA